MACRSHLDMDLWAEAGFWLLVAYSAGLQKFLPGRGWAADSDRDVFSARLAMD